MKLLSSDRQVPWESQRPFYNVVSADMKKNMTVCVLNTKQCTIWAVIFNSDHTL